MIVRRLFVLCGLMTASLAEPEVARAASVTIDVRTSGGAPIADAVLTIDAPGAARTGPVGTYVMEQRDIAFHPHVLIVPVGATVSFPNRDPVRHHVYSFSKAKKFDLKLYSREEQRQVVFDRAGIVALGCNIHDAMSGFIVVTDDALVAKTNAAGRATIIGVPGGGATLHLWSPSIRAAGNTLTRPIAVTATGAAATIVVR